MDDVRVRVSLDTSGMESGANRANGVLGSLKGRMGEVKAGLQDVSKTFVATGAVILGAVGGIIAKGADWQAGIEEVDMMYGNLEKSTQSFIDTKTKEAEKWALTDQQARRYYTTAVSNAKAAGMSAEETEKLSDAQVRLAAEYAAAKNIDMETAYKHVTSAINGNTASMLDNGVQVRQADAMNTEYAKGLNKTWKEMSDYERQTATLEAAQKSLSGTWGLAEQEAGGFIAQMSQLKTRIGEVVGEIGASLLPVLEPLIQKFVEVVQKIGDWVSKNPELTRTILMIVAGIGAFLVVAGTLIGIVAALTGVFLLFSAATAPVTLTIIAIVAGIMLLVAVVAILIFKWDEIKAKTIEIWNAIKEFCTNTWNSIKEAATNVWNSIKEFFSNTWNAIKEAASSIWEGIKSFILNLMNAIATGIRTYLNTVKAFWTAVWNAVKAVAQAVWNGIKAVITTVANAIKTVITTVFNAVKTYITTVFNAIKTVATTVWNGIKTVITTACNGVKSTVSSVFNGLKNTVKTALDGIYNTAKGIWDKITGIFSKPIKAVVNFVKGGDKSLAKGVAPQSFSPLGGGPQLASYARGAMTPSLAGSGGAPMSLTANMNTSVVLDGKTIAKASAPYMKTEIDKLNKRQNRLGGR